MYPVPEYYRALQEGSRRACGRALPWELVQIILFVWGGLMTPSALAMTRFVASAPWCVPDSGPGCHVACPESRSDRVRPITSVLCRWSPRGWGRGWGCVHYGTAEFPTWPHYRQYSDDYLCLRPTALEADLLYGSGGERWRQAVACRGGSSAFAYALGALCEPGRREGYRLMLRAETDASWRFWADLLQPRGVGTSAVHAALSLTASLAIPTYLLRSSDTLYQCFAIGAPMVLAANGLITVCCVVYG